MNRRAIMKLVAGFVFVAGVLLLAESGAIDLDIGSLDIGGLAILAVGLALGVVLIFRFFDANYDDEGHYTGRKGKSKDRNGRR